MQVYFLKDSNLYSGCEVGSRGTGLTTENLSLEILEKCTKGEYLRLIATLCVCVDVGVRGWGKVLGVPASLDLLRNPRNVRKG